MSNEEVIMIDNKELMKQLKNIEKDPSYIDYFIDLMKRYSQEAIVESIDVIKVALESIHIRENKKAFIELLLIKARCHFVLGEYGKAIISLLEEEPGLKESTGKIEQDLMIQFYNTLLVGYTARGEVEEAAKYGLKGLEYAEQLERPEAKAQLLINIAHLYMCIKSYIKAEEILDGLESINYILRDTTKIDREIAWLRLYLCTNRLELAAEHIKIAYSLIKKSEKQYQLCLMAVLSLRAEIYVRRGLYTQAEKDFNEVEQRIQKVPYKNLEQINLLRWAQYDKEQGRIEESICKLEKIIKLEGESPFIVKESYRVLSEIYEEKEEWVLAYTYLKKYEDYEKYLTCETTYKEVYKLSQIDIGKEIEKYKLLYEDMQALARIGVALTENLQTIKISPKIHAQFCRLFKMDLLSIFFIEQEEFHYQLLNREGKAIEENKLLIKNTYYLADYCLQERRDVVVSDGDFTAYHIKEINGEETLQVESAIFTPIIINDRAVGAIGIGSYKSNVFNNNDLNFLQVIASYLAIAIQNTNLYHQAEYLGKHDCLTGLLNRGAVLQQGEALFKRNRKEHKSTTIMMIDIDFFKQINDRYGHQLGDEVLVKIGKILKEVVRKEDYVGRYGGEEFLLVLDNLKEKDVIKVCKRIKEALAESHFETKKDTPIKATVSGGFYTCNEYTLHFSDAIQFADHALYRAKLLGRDRMICYSLGED